MQAIAPVTTAQLLRKEQRPPLLKFEIKYCCCWVDLTPYVIKESLSISTAGAEMTPAPVAGDWSVSLFNKNGRFDPDENAYAPRNEYLRVGRKVRISIGARYGGVDYYWRRIYGFMELPDFSIDKSEVYLNGFDNMQLLTDTKLRMPNNYWGADITKSTIASEEILGAEMYLEDDAMEIIADADNVDFWDILYRATIVDIAPGGAPSTNVGLIVKGAPGVTFSYVENNNVGTVEQGKEYKVVFEYKRIVVGQLSVGIYKSNAYYGTADATEANKLHDADGGFIASLVGATVYNVTDQTTATVTAFVDAGELTLSANIMVTDERYIIYHEEGENIMGEVTGLTAVAWTEETFNFTATESCDIKMRVTIRGESAVATQFHVDVFSIKEVTEISNAGYNLPDDCNGPYYVTLDGEPIYYRNEGAGWYYESETKRIFIENGRVLVADQSLRVYYFTTQLLEEVVADLLATAGLYDNQAEALADMIYTGTAINVDQVWFKKGTTIRDAIEVICERCNYRFYFNYSGRPDFNPAPAPVSACDVTTDWSGTALSIDTVDKKEGIGSLKNTVAAPVFPPATNYNTNHNPAGTWDWSAKEHTLFWLKSDRASTAFTYARAKIYDTLGNVRYWDLTFSAGEWTAFKLLLSTGDGVAPIAPDLALINQFRVTFRTADAIPFYMKLDNIWVTDFTFNESHITNIRDYEDRSEIRNRIVIEGKKEAQPIEPEEAMPSELKGEASEVASINKYGEHTWPMKNHLFQDQVPIDVYKAIYLAAFKDPKWYATFETPYNPVPLVKGDVVTWRKKYEVGGTPINQGGIIRNIEIDEFVVSYKIEKII